jgi:hypothetical protein
MKTILIALALTVGCSNVKAEDNNKTVKTEEKVTNPDNNTTEALMEKYRVKGKPTSPFLKSVVWSPELLKQIEKKKAESK